MIQAYAYLLKSVAGFGRYERKVWRLLILENGRWQAGVGAFWRGSSIQHPHLNLNMLGYLKFKKTATVREKLSENRYFY